MNKRILSIKRGKMKNSQNVEQQENDIEYFGGIVRDIQDLSKKSISQQVIVPEREQRK